MEVKVRLREPLSGQDMQTSTERWLVVNHTQVTLKVIFLLRLTVLIQLLMMFFFSQGSCLDAAKGVLTILKVHIC